MKTRNLVIYGDSAFAERIAAYIKLENTDNVLAFTIDRNFRNRETINGLDVIPLDELPLHFDPAEFDIIIAIGYSRMNDVRKQIHDQLLSSGYSIGSYISQKAAVYSQDIGPGAIIFPGVFIGQNCRIGKCNIVMPGTIMAHDNTVGDYNTFSINAVLGGAAKIGNNCFLGLHSTVKSAISIADYTLLGSGANIIAAITSDESGGGVWVGNPARKLKNKSVFDVKI